jgi:hypothetical protein
MVREPSENEQNGRDAHLKISPRGTFRFRRTMTVGDPSRSAAQRTATRDPRAAAPSHLASHLPSLSLLARDVSRHPRAGTRAPRSSPVVVSRFRETMPATVSRSVRSTHASAKAADVLETSAAAACKRLSPTRESLVSKKKRRPRVSALVGRLEALLLSGASRASPPDPDGIGRATRRSRHRRPRRIPPSQATSDDAPKRRAPDAERRELTASKTPKSRRPGAVRDKASNSNSRSTSNSHSQPQPLATRPSDRSTRAPRCPPAPSNTTREMMRAYAAATRSRARRRRFARPIASLASPRLLGTRLPDPDAVARLLEGHIDTFGTCITARTLPFPEHAPALTPTTATEPAIEPATAPSLPCTPPFSPAPSSAGERLLRSPGPSSVVGEGELDTFGSNLPVSARLRGEHLERDGDTLAARLPGDVFASTRRIARRDSVASLASTWIPEEDDDEDDEGTNATRSGPSPCEWEDAIEDDGKKRFTASFLTSPVAWTPASPAPRRRRRKA